MKLLHLLLFVSIFYVFSCFAYGNRFDTRLNYREKKATLFLINPGDRLGDHLINYIRAKWIAFQNNIPLYVNEEKYFHNFNIFEKDQYFNKLPIKQSVYIDSLVSLIPIKTLEKDINLIIDHVHYCPKGGYEWKDLQELKNNSKFLKVIKQVLTPKIPLDIIYPPKDIKSVAIHVRKGGGYDNKLLSQQYYIQNSNNKKMVQNIAHPGCHPIGAPADMRFPTRFIPEIFYAKALKYLSNSLRNPALYVFIFTDDHNPQELCSRLSTHIGLDNIILDCRNAPQALDQNVVYSDLFSFKNFNYLIRPSGSHFSLMADFLSNHEQVLSSGEYHWEVNELDQHFLIIDTLNIRKGEKTSTIKLDY